MAEQPAPKRARIDASHIELLTPNMFVAGSRHSAATPALKRFEVHDGGTVDVEWEATGSSVYSVSARGRVRVSFDERGRLRGEGLAVRCTCPDAARQSGVHLCKHAYAAIQSVVDPDADEKITELGAAARATAEAARAAQDVAMPGERKRVVNALAHLPPAEVVEFVRKAALGSVEGLHAVAAYVFPADAVAAPNVLHCLRCDEDYDPALCGEKACRVLHPFTEEGWETSKMSWELCLRCDATFNVVGRPRGIRDDGEYCFEGDHTADPVPFKQKGWDNPDDYCE